MYLKYYRCTTISQMTSLIMDITKKQHEEDLWKHHAKLDHPKEVQIVKVENQ